MNTALNTYERRFFTDLERFREKVNIVLDKTSCWEWKGQIDKRTGYGVFWYNNMSRFAHRAVFQVVHSMPLLERKQHSCHKCDNRPCIRPSHLKLANAKWNAQDRNKKGRGNTLAGERVSWSKLSNADIPQIIELRRQGLTHKQIADKYGVSRQAIGKIFEGKQWLSVSQLPPHPNAYKTLTPRRIHNA